MSVRNRRRVAMGAALLFLWGWVFVQWGMAQVNLPAGEWFNPQPSPSNPDVIAVERRQGDRQVIQFVDNVKGSFSGMPPKAEAADQSAQMNRYEGDLAWRPALDARGRQWFAFVSDRDGERDIYVSWITVRPAMVVGEPVRLPFDGNETAPRWSPEGNRLVFVADGRLYLENDMSTILNGDRAEAARMFRPGRLIEEPVRVSDPDWAPDGTHLAFTARDNGAGKERKAIGIIPIPNMDDTIFPVAAGRVVASELYASDKFRPSWSPDGHYLAYYIQAADTGRSEYAGGLVDIGIAEVVSRASTGIVVDLEVRSGTSGVVDQMVWPHPHRGPEWRLYQDVFGREQPSLITIRRGDAGSTLLVEHRIDEWLNNRTRYQTILSRGTVEASGAYRQLGSVKTPRGMRLVYLADRENQSRLLVEDMEDRDARSLMMPVDRSPKTAAWRSALFPGLGQFYKGQSGRGLLFAVLETVSLGTLVYFTMERSELKDDYDRFEHYYYNPEEGMGTLPPDHYGRRSIGGAVSHFYLEWEGAYEALKTNRRVQWIAGSAAAAIWLLNIYDSTRGFPLQVKRDIGEGHLDLDLRPDFAMYGVNSWSPGIKLTIKL